MAWVQSWEWSSKELQIIHHMSIWGAPDSWCNVCMSYSKEWKKYTLTTSRFNAKSLSIVMSLVMTGWVLHIYQCHLAMKTVLARLCTCVRIWHTGPFSHTRAGGFAAVWLKVSCTMKSWAYILSLHVIDPAQHTLQSHLKIMIDWAILRTSVRIWDLASMFLAM